MVNRHYCYDTRLAGKLNPTAVKKDQNKGEKLKIQRNWKKYLNQEIFIILVQH